MKGRWAVMHDRVCLASLGNKAREVLFGLVLVFGFFLCFSFCNKLLKVWAEVLITYRITSGYRISHYQLEKATLL